MPPSFDLLLATAYAPPVSFFSRLYSYQGKRIGLEAHEHYLKQSYRNRCRILSPNGIQSLTIPVELSAGGKTPIRDVRISAHSDWRHLHLQALRTAYGATPFFQYYIDELLPFYERKYAFLWDFNGDLLTWLLQQLDLEVELLPTEEFLPPSSSSEIEDLRYIIQPRRAGKVPGFMPQPYYQGYADRYGFTPELSIFDLLFEQGPEALLTLRDSTTSSLPLIHD